MSRAPTDAPAPPRIAVVDHGAGNLVSIEHGLIAAGAAVMLASQPAELAAADAVILPGVGAAGPAMTRLARQGLVEPLRAWVRGGRPLLGICLGLQLLFESSDEDAAETLGLLAGRSVRLNGAPTLPHIGWNQVSWLRDDPLLDGIPDGADLYFVHSYSVLPAPSDAAVILATTEHGDAFVSAIARGSLYGVQFHPERSGRDGLRLLRNFVAIVAAGGSARAGRDAIGRPAAAGALLP